MLQAKTKDGVLVTLAILTKTEINQLKQDRVLFYCPACHQRVLIKAGVKMIPHFAHRSIAACPSGEGGEGMYHETGKLLLYRWLKQQGLSVKLEVYLPQIRQRPDILLRIRDKAIAIEFQCAPISIEEVRKRNIGYKQAGITPIWILGENRLQRISKTHFKLTHHHLPFIHPFSPGATPTLFFFSTDTRHFILIQDIYMTGNSQAAGKFFIRPLNQLSFKDLFKEYAFNPKDLYTMWAKEKYKLRLKQTPRLYGQELAWHQWMYLKGIHREVLPAMIHLPVSHQFKMKTPAWNWQSRLVLDVIDPMAAGDTFSLQRVHHILRAHVYPSETFPFIHSEKSPIKEYLHLLSLLNIIQQSREGMFVKLKPVFRPVSLEQAINEDKKVLYYLLKQNRSMIHL